MKSAFFCVCSTKLVISSIATEAFTFAGTAFAHTLGWPCPSHSHIDSNMAREKPQYPPQGGEARICGSLVIAMLLSVLSAVTMIYSTVIVYVPSQKLLNSGFQGPETCTTIKARIGLQGQEQCQGWSSCEEWCLSVSPDACSHIWASVRRQGVSVNLTQCHLSHDGFRDKVCPTLEDIEPINCKIFEHQVDSEGRNGSKQVCINMENDIVSCQAGICKNVSRVYDCDFRSSYEVIKDHNDGLGECFCTLCDTDNTRTIAKQDCHPDTRFCLEQDHHSLNSTMAKTCGQIKCQDCWDLCRAQGKCLVMNTRRDPPNLGRDEWDRPLQRYYHCSGGSCIQISNLKCRRRCDELESDFEDINSIIRSEERVVLAKCDTVNQDAFAMSLTCTNLEIDKASNAIHGHDCIDGKWLKDKPVNFSSLLSMISRSNWYVSAIPSEASLIMANSTKVKINMEGCVNTLKKECKAFYHMIGKDGRNFTARSVYPCFFDPDQPDFVIYNFDKDRTAKLLFFTSVIPAIIFILSCGWLCCCNRLVHVAKDGRMRLRCCGQYVTGTGNVHTRI